MDKFLAECIQDTTIDGITVGYTYEVEYQTDYKVKYNQTKTTFELVVGNHDWFYEHFKPLRCTNCRDVDGCKVYDEGREYACYGHSAQ